MTSKTKRPGDALQRIPGTKVKSSQQATFNSEVYANRDELQTRRLRHQFGLDDQMARVIAGLFFGEGR